MFLIVGLGNPGKKYEKTRHNIGFRIIDNLQSKIDDFSNWKKEKKLLAEISEGKIGDEKLILAKPQTFMNNSGKSIKLSLKEFFHNSAMAELKKNNFWVINDDFDITLGKIKIVKNRGPAGHKGVESIIRELKTKNFVRFRIGIQPIGKNYAMAQKLPVEKFVLEKFTKAEEKIVKEVIKKTIEAIEVAIKEGVEKAMAKYN